MADIRWVKPGSLRLPPEREDGADEFKLSRQLQEFGETFDTMPPILVMEGADGELQIYNGVTRATRAYQADPEMQVPVEVTGMYPQWDFRDCPTVADVS